MSAPEPVGQMDPADIHEAPSLSPAAQAAVEAETDALTAHMQQAQMAYLSQRLHALAVENADLREAKDKKG